MEKSCDKWTSQQETTYQNLVEECTRNPPNKGLSSSLRRELESMEPGARTEVVGRMHDGWSPLFLACKSRNVNIVKYLVHACGADVNQSSGNQMSNDIDEYPFTPLWLAIETGNLAILRVLADAGADLYAVSYNGITPMFAACEFFNYHIVKFLIERGADIQRLNYEDETCLMQLLHCVPLCVMLIKKGINVNACSTYGETALHLSVMKNKVPTADLLLRHGADPHVPLPEGGDVLQLACLNGNSKMVKLLTRRVCYPRERLVDMYDLLAATLILKFDNVGSALSFWRQSLVLRAQHQLPKQPEMAPHVVFHFVREFCNEDELAAAGTDEDALETQALLVYERLLSNSVHRALCDQVMLCGLKYAKTMKRQRCVDLWLWLLEICLRNSVFGIEIHNTALELTWVFLAAKEDRFAKLNESVPRIQDVFHAFSLLTDSVSARRRALDVQPNRMNQSSFDNILLCITNLLNILLSLLEEEDNKEEGQRWKQILHEKLCWLVAQDLRIIATGDTLLHLCVLFEYTSSPSLYIEEPDHSKTRRCVRALLAAGAEINARNLAGRTPLHTVARPIWNKFNLEFVLELLEAGAHIDQPDRSGQTPVAVLAANPASRIPLLRYQTLQCLAANVLVRHGVKLIPGVLPKKIIQFLQLHKRD